jgi:hypothetical protein
VYTRTNERDTPAVRKEPQIDTATALGALGFECGNPATEHHHVVPQSRGGTKTVPLCGACHGLAHNIRRPADMSALTREGLAVRRAQGVRLGGPPTIAPELANRIRSMRFEDGMTLWQMADTLTAEGIPPPRGRQWRPTSFRAVLRQG